MIKNILKYIFIFILILTIFVTEVNADTIIAPVQYITNDTNLHISNNMGADIQLNSTVQNSNNIDIKKFVMNINYNFKGNVIYQVELSTPTQYLININNVSILSSDNTCSFKGITDANVGFPKIRFTCPYDTNYVTIGLSNLSDNNITSSYNFRWNYTYLSIVNENVVDLNPVLDGQGQIKDEITDSTNTITGSINDTENNINQNIDDMEQSIVDSNKETQDVIKDQFNTCRVSYNIFNPSNVLNGYTNDNTGSIGGNGISTGYIEIISGKNYYILSNKTSGNWGAWYDENKNYISGITLGANIDGIVKSPTNAKYLSFSVSTYNNNPDYANNVMIAQSDVSLDYEPFGEQICQNKIDDTNDKLGDLNSSLNDSDVNGSLGNAGSFFDNFTTTDHGGLSGIITAPLVAINQMLNTSCNPMTTTFKGKELSLPCGYEFWNKMGPIQDFVNLVLGGLLCYQIIIKLYKLIEKIKNPEDDRLEVMDL